MSTHRTHAIMLLAALAVVGPPYAADSGLHGTASGWLGASLDTSVLGLAGLRYLPEAQLSVPVRGQLKLYVEASVNAFLTADIRERACSLDVRLKPYRGFVRLSSARFEARAGLQKINFGSAMLLRPLQWFDRVDPRDPLGLTDGVYGLLARYYFQDNANLWAWGLLGNSSPKGWEQVGSERWIPEFGGRAQLPIPRGELAATYHHRVADYGGTTETDDFLTDQDEDRFGLDAKVDAGIGLCFEGTLSRVTRRTLNGDLFPLWTRAAVVGVDYTVGLGAGLGAAAEHLFAGSANEPLGRGTDVQFSAVMVSYPLDLLDNLRGIVFFDWTGHRPYSYLAWQRTLDNWVFSVAGFWYPDRPVLIPGQAAGGVGGKGLQVTVVFNH